MHQRMGEGAGNGIVQKVTEEESVWSDYLFGKKTSKVSTKMFKKIDLKSWRFKVLQRWLRFSDWWALPVFCVVLV